ncbi:MAG: LLM class flavin-dependent oxidoreductase [Acidobacteria bacterium]|nr:LLM class flavin-dependent oxidoreductase [Acidobacteriota bacterium]
MDDITTRLASLTPEQRELLEHRLKRQGLHTPPAGAAVPDAAGPPRAGPGVEVTHDTAWQSAPPAGEMSFGLYFFSGDGAQLSDDKYRLIIECAKFADRHGFTAVWTPERHFQNFGGLYPNPSVLSAALAVLTERVEIRAGSVALPLHHPVRVAEEWSVVDNLSRGRVAVSFASGWHPDDFLFAPDAYERRKEVMYRHIEVIRKLWAGESTRLPGVGGQEVEVRMLPRPVQQHLPIWLTSAGSPETWRRAGELGANVLAAYVSYSPDELARRVALYREARARHGHDPRTGVVTMMLHTFVGPDDAAVKSMVRRPLTNYLRTYFKQFEKVRFGADSFPEADKAALMDAAFEHHFAERTLMGSPSKCAGVLDQLARADVNETACLVDFGLPLGAVLEGLHHLDALRRHYAPKQPCPRSQDLS